MSTGTITVTAAEPPVDADLARRRAARRLRPLYLALALGGLMLWVPVEKLFMTELGFDATAVGIMAGVYALVVPLLEVPSGILADRWSRKGVLMSAYAALLASVLVCGLAGDVTTYVIGAGLLGVYLALQSGTLESMVYDVLQEELGDGGGFEATIGRVRAVESAALAASAIAAGCWRWRPRRGSRTSPPSRRWSWRSCSSLASVNRACTRPTSANRCGPRSQRRTGPWSNAAGCGRS